MFTLPHNTPSGTHLANSRDRCRYPSDVMASLRILAVLLCIAMTMAAVSDALVLCPQFPSCCYNRRPNGRDTCHALCPSCREAREFTNGVRNRPSRRRRPDISFIAGDPFAFPNSDIFPSPLVIL
ncbi:uncharacterized protein LOC135196855 [Macrobrachium nipponense]|uniref:uncharacterized protein LOC135196855 n=1 Tax=Macrobrachium nipponense TaxID=159736 RepID=UPI0030C7B7FF